MSSSVFVSWLMFLFFCCGMFLQIISPYNLYLNPTLVVKQYQFWRLVTNFLYFRNMGTPLRWIHSLLLSWDTCVEIYLLSFVSADLDFLFHMFFLARYCKLLEENSFRGKTADFLYMLLFGATVLTGIVLIGGMIPYLSVSFSKIIFLSNSLTFMMVTPFLPIDIAALDHFFSIILTSFLSSFRSMYGASKILTSTWVSLAFSLLQQLIYHGWVAFLSFSSWSLLTRAVAQIMIFLKIVRLQVLLGFSVLVGASPWGDLLVHTLSLYSI